MFGVPRARECALSLCLLCCALPFTASGQAASHFKDNSKDAVASDIPSFRVNMDVQLALIPVHVTNRDGGAVTGLSKGAFRLFDDGTEQKISFFASEDAPVSVGFLIDSSESMKPKMDRALRAANEFLKFSNPGDEFFVVEFNERAHLTLPFTQDMNLLQDRLFRKKSFGRTALLDAIQLGILEQKKAHNSRKALVILSDGGDNHSRHKEREIRALVQESDVQIFAVGLFDPDAKTMEEQHGPILLTELAEQTGGKNFPVETIEELPSVCSKVHTELHNQYLLGYTPDSRPQDGRYHKVKVMVNDSSVSKLHVQHRPGYFAPQGR